MALKLHNKRSSTVTRSTTAVWQELLLKFSSRVVLDMQTIVEFKRGLEFSRLLKLPTDLTFNYPRMAEFIVAGKRPLSHVEWVHLYVHVYTCTLAVVWKLLGKSPAQGNFSSCVNISFSNYINHFQKCSCAYFSIYCWFSNRWGCTYMYMYMYTYMHV